MPATRQEQIEQFIHSLRHDRTLPLGAQALSAIVLDDYLDVGEDTPRERLREPRTYELYIELGKRAHQLVSAWSLRERGVDDSLPLVLFDMDGVLYDYETEVERRLSAVLGRTVQSDVSKAMYIEDRLDDPDEIELVKRLQYEKGLFAAIPLMDGAVDGWKSILANGFRAQVCSAPLRKNLWCIRDKRRSLRRDFGARVADEAIIDRDKFRHPGTVLIEDNPTPRHADQASWRLVIFDWPYNRSVSGISRVFGWRDPALQETLRSTTNKQ